MANQIDNNNINLITQFIAEVSAIAGKAHQGDLTAFKAQIKEDLEAYQHEYRGTKADLMQLSKQKNPLYAKITQYYATSCEKSANDTLIFAPNIPMQQELVSEIEIILSKSASSYARMMRRPDWSQKFVTPLVQSKATSTNPLADKLPIATTATTTNGTDEKKDDQKVPELIRQFMPRMDGETKIIS
jgi:hypothetical protein